LSDLGRFKVTSSIDGRGNDIVASWSAGAGFAKVGLGDIVVNGRCDVLREVDWKTRTGQPV
jgi:hypothetical protein